MARTLNGYPVITASDSGLLRWYAIPGTKRKVLLNRYIGPIIVDFLRQWNEKMPERLSLDKGPIDGWARPRKANAANGWSNHSGGTAVDVRYDVLKADNRRHMTNEERSILVKILSQYDGVLDNGYRWNHVDEMHTEIAPGTSVARVQALQRKLRIDSKGVRAATLPPKQPSPAPKATVSLKAARRAAATDPKAKPGVRGVSVSNVRVIETALNKEGLLAKKYMDGSYGTKTVEAYKKWQIRLGFTGSDADGIPGVESLRRLGGKYGFKVVS
jgi:hypothetical protein